MFGGRRINVEKTAGGGGAGEDRKAKIADKKKEQTEAQQAETQSKIDTMIEEGALDAADVDTQAKEFLLQVQCIDATRARMPFLTVAPSPPL